MQENQRTDFFLYRQIPNFTGNTFLMKHILQSFYYITFFIPLFSNAQQVCTPAVLGTTYQVTTDADAGPGSLRQAILDANAAGVGGTIEIMGAWTNFPINTQLPSVTCDSLEIFPYLTTITIDGQNIVPEPGISFASSTSCTGPFVTGINFIGAIITVTNTNDAGTGSLREAIRAINFSPSTDQIRFDIPGLAPHSIQLASPLPSIISPVIIDGNSQPPNGFTGFAPKIEIAGTGGNSTGLYFNYAFAPNQFDASVFGLYLHGFGTAIRTSATDVFTLGQDISINVISGNAEGVALQNDNQTIVKNNYIGLDPTGQGAQGNSSVGISVLGLPSASHLFQYNVISGNENAGVVLFAGGRNFVFKSNFIGTDRTGAFGIPNHNVGISCSANQVTFGGSQNGDANIFSGNGVNNGVNPKAALLIDGDSCLVLRNKFGTDLTGTISVPNNVGSALLLNGSRNRVGGPNTTDRNIFTSSPFGISGSQGTGNTIQNNFFGTNYGAQAIMPNGVAISLDNDSAYITNNRMVNNTTGIEFGNGANGNVVTLNNISVNTADGIWNAGIENKFTQNSIFNNGNKGIVNFQGANNGIQPPVITFASVDSVTGTSLPLATIEVFYSQSLNANPQGMTMFGVCTADAAGNWKYAGTVLNPVIVTATQRDFAGNTSEFATTWLLNTSYVWPGDCNYDLTVNNVDFLYMGLAYGNNGPARANASLNWVAQPMADWPTSFYAGINHKHADCNGDGTVSMTDAAAITQNYGLNHPFRITPPLPANAIYNFYLSAVNDTIAPGGFATFDIHCGTNSLPVDSLYGVAWSLIWNPALANAFNIVSSYIPSALGVWQSGCESFEYPLYSIGRTQSALTRTTQTDTFGVNGVIGRISFQVSWNISSPTLFVVNPDDVQGASYPGMPVDFNFAGDTVVIDPAFVGLHHVPAMPQLQVYPNPACDQVQIVSAVNRLKQIKIFDTHGRLIRMLELDSRTIMLPVHDIKNGHYLVETSDEDGHVNRTRLMISR
jgi:hypothetical protein